MPQGHRHLLSKGSTLTVTVPLDGVGFTNLALFFAALSELEAQVGRSLSIEGDTKLYRALATVGTLDKQPHGSLVGAAETLQIPIGTIDSVRNKVRKGGK